LSECELLKKVPIHLLDHDWNLFADQEEDGVGTWNEDACNFCKKDGREICCDTCPAVYHLQCLMQNAPASHAYAVHANETNSKWACPTCYFRVAGEQVRPVRPMQGEYKMKVRPAFE
jgi:hypothetical protein